MESNPFRKPWYPLNPERPTSSFPHKFSEAGSSTVTVEIGARDALDSDNRRSSSIAVLDRLGVLLVDGSPSEEWLQRDRLFEDCPNALRGSTDKEKHSGERFDRGIRNSGRQTDPAVIKDGNQR